MDKPKIILGLLSRMRVPQLRTAVNSARSTVGDDVDLEIVVVFDDDFAGFKMCPNWDGVHKYLATPRHYYCRAANKLYGLCDRLAKETDTDFFFFTHDDTEFVGSNWGSVVLNGYDAAFGTDPEDGGILECFGQGLCSHYLTQFSFINRYLRGEIASPMYTNYFSDSHLLNLCAEVEKYAAMGFDVRSAVINHQMYATRDAPSWEVQEAWFRQDKMIYDIRWPMETLQELAPKWKIVNMAKVEA